MLRAMGDPVVEIDSGQLRGARRRGVSVFLGIPYAGSVAGSARFAPPEPVTPWRGLRDARRPGPPAAQNAPELPLGTGWFGFTRERPDEARCLNLNVTTPACDGNARPVLVWLHGGAFVFGAGSAALYAAESLARAGDVVVVTLNYRLGASGFLYLGEASEREPERTNLGLRDQRAALAWVQRNIARFGGSPESVCLFGESAGAMSIAAQLGVSAPRPLFHRAILQSGAAHHISSTDRAARIGNALLEELQIRGDAWNGLARVPWPALCAAQRRVAGRMGFEAGRLPWQPVADGRFLRDPSGPETRREAPPVPLVIGTNADEWKLFTAPSRKLRKLDDAGLTRRLRAVLSGLNDVDGWIERARSVYARELASEEGPHEAWCAFQRDRVFTEPARALAASRSQAGARVHRYRFAWRHPLFAKRLGACHGLEVPFVFGTARRGALAPLLGAVPGAGSTIRRLQSAWCLFARDARPGDERRWPAASAGAGPILVFHNAGASLEAVPDPGPLALHADLAQHLREVEGNVS